MVRYSIQFFLLVALLCPVSFVRAQSSNSRCAFTDCGTGDDPFSQSGESAAAPAEELHTCRTEDRESCKGECRSTFGPEFHLCVSECLAKICEESAEQAESRPSAAEQLCVEDSSEACVDECKKLSDSSAARCRRECLTKLCPTSSANDIVAESSSPGKVACNSCRADVERECARTCAAGSVIVGKSTGLINLGCEKACVIGRCGENCISLSPF